MPAPTAQPTGWRLGDFFKPPTSPSEYIARSVRQSGVSLTIGVFIGASVTTGIFFGLAAAWLANERVLRRLVKNAGVLVHHVRDAALNTREGRALAKALLAPETAAPSHSPAPPAATEPVALDSRLRRPIAAGTSGRGLAALREDEVLPQVAPAGGHYLPYQLGPGNLVYLSGYISRTAEGALLTGACLEGAHLARLPAPSPHALDASAGAEAARTCALGHLALLSDCCGGLSNVKQFVKATCFVNCLPTPVLGAALAGAGAADAPYFSDSPAVANGYSDLMSDVFGSVGGHARSAVCVAGLPFGAVVEVEAVVELFDLSLVAA